MLRMYPVALHDALERLEQAAHDHAEWNEHLLRVIFCGQPCRPDDRAANAHVRCDLGRWLHQQAPAALRELPSFEIIAREHERLHRIAAQLLDDVEADAPVVRKEFEDLVAAEEGHWDQFDRQSDFVKRFGERYLALQSFQGGPPEGGAAQ